jgi:UPF0716 protein FxsA
MSLVKWGFVALLALPLAELAAMIAVALTVGWLWTVAACLVTSVAGAILLRRSGRTHLDRFLAAMGRDGLGAIHLESPGLPALLGGILLLIPGFITDVLGALLFLPAFRRWARGRIARSRGDSHSTGRNARGGRTVIDLSPEEWRHLPDRPLEGKPRRKSGNKSGSRSGSKSGT